jgi:dUTP pyrophosphatase
MSVLKIKLLENFDKELELPKYETAQAAGADLRACLVDSEPFIIKPGQRVLIPTGLSFEIEPGYEVQIRPRSGLSLKTGLLVVNSPGTIDADYRGEVKIILGNMGDNVEIIHHGDRIAQMVMMPITQAKFEITDTLSETDRGTGGFGSTGKS